ncbi:GIY-YIG nuclease family protein [Brevundimonas sp. NPDC049575]
MASRRNGTIYTGVTSDLHDRVWKHKLGTFKGFTDDHACKGLVWFEPHLGMTEAIAREKQIKKWRRAWKLALIEAVNPVWKTWRRIGVTDLSCRHPGARSEPGTQRAEPAASCPVAALCVERPGFRVRLRGRGMTEIK